MKNLFAFFCVVAMVAALFIGGAQPFAVGLFCPPWDKLAHLLFFLVLVVLLRLSLGVPLWLLAGSAIILGAADEIHQIWLPGRSAGFDDWLADVVGVVFAVVIIRRWEKSRDTAHNITPGTS
jgi:VanZ family protein